jgi:tRNA-specific 2-thiouridylase
MNKKRKKVVLGMSGGVDSSVAAFLLQKKGYEVTGIFMRFWREKNKVKKTDDDEKSARQSAKILGIDFKAVDAREEFKKEVVEYFLKSYQVGITPNPCIFCNANMKFKTLFKLADKAGAEYVATGHYAKIAKRETRSAKQYELFEAKDKNKDQSYFLYRLKQEQLARIIFPLGGYEKEEIKKIAKKLNLPAHKRKESQDVCFLGRKGVGEFLKNNLKLKGGDIVNLKGKLIGKHSGLPLYTVGQRKGINIGGTGPYYVAKKDYEKNRLIVTDNSKEIALFSELVTLENVNWIADKPKLPFRARIRIRYRNPLIYATINKYKAESSGHKAEYEIQFREPQRAVASGQSVVFYGKKGEIIGGGIIK